MFVLAIKAQQERARVRRIEAARVGVFVVVVLALVFSWI